MTLLLAHRKMTMDVLQKCDLMNPMMEENLMEADLQYSNSVNGPESPFSRRIMLKSLMIESK